MQKDCQRHKLYTVLLRPNHSNGGVADKSQGGCKTFHATCAGTRQEAEQMERVVKPFLDSHMQALLLELLSVLQLLR